MATPQNARTLTHDERKAAEAAFSGRPFNAAWSDSAKRIYEGLIRALPHLPEESTREEIQVDQSEAKAAEAAVALPAAPELKLDAPAQEEVAQDVRTNTTAQQLVTNRQQAIEAGLLIDVTADAQKLGLSFPVTITKPLWEIGIAPSHALSEADKSERLRDVLMAFRLRLASQATLSPLIDFPAMVALPPGAVPQPVPLYALILPDQQHRAMVTLLLPNEVSASIIPMN
jgi:hypothetical protein